MAYTPTVWVNKVTKLGPTNLNKLEEGLEDAAAIADTANALAAAAVPKSVVDAAGDLIVGTGADTVGRLAKGATEGHVLSIVSGALAWAAGSAGVLSGTRAARPAAGTAGRLYVATDQIALYFDTGSVWTRLPPAAGTTVHFDGTTAPAGYVLRDGATYNAVSNLLYKELFDAIGTTHGGTGESSFLVADARGRADVTHDGGDADWDTVGEKRGAKTHTLTEAEMPSHRHSVTGTSVPGGLVFGSGGSDWAPSTQNTTFVGGGGAHNNLQPSIVGLGLVKL